MSEQRPIDRLARAALFALVFLAPFGTRYIWRYGEINGIQVEWGTVSLFGTQILALIYVILAAVAAGWSRLGRAVRQPVMVAAAVLVGLAVLAAVRSAAVWSAWSSLVPASWLLLGIMIAAASLAWRPPLSWLLWPLFLSALIQAALAFVQFLVQSVLPSLWLGLAGHSASQLGSFVVEASGGRWLRAYGTFDHPNILGFYLALALLAAVGLSVSAGPDGRNGPSRQWLRTLAWAGVPILAAGLFVSFSKSAILAILSGLLVLMISAQVARLGRTSRAALLAALLILGALGSQAVLMPDVVASRLDLSGRLEARSWDQRISLAGDAAALLGRHPWLGVGPGQMPMAVRLEIDPARSAYDYQPIHNVPILVGVETGVFGAAVWLGLLATLAGLAVIRVRRRRRLANQVKPSPAGRSDRLTSGLSMDQARQIAVRLNEDDAPAESPDLSVGLGFLAAILTVAMFDHFLWSLWPGQLLFWLTLALIGRTVSAGER